MIDHMLISQNQTPPKRLILKMYHMQVHLADMNQRLMSGMAVSTSDWEKLRRLSTRMGDTFHQVSFDWKEDEVDDFLDSIPLTMEDQDPETGAESEGIS